MSLAVGFPSRSFNLSFWVESWSVSDFEWRLSRFSSFLLRSDKFSSGIAAAISLLLLDSPSLFPVIPVSKRKFLLSVAVPFSKYWLRYYRKVDEFTFNGVSCLVSRWSFTTGQIIDCFILRLFHCLGSYHVRWCLFRQQVSIIHDLWVCTIWQYVFEKDVDAWGTAVRVSTFEAWESYQRDLKIEKTFF